MKWSTRVSDSGHTYSVSITDGYRLNRLSHVSEYVVYISGSESNFPWPH